METISQYEKDQFWKTQKAMLDYCKGHTLYNPEKGPREYVLSLIQMSLDYINQEKPDDKTLQMIAQNMISIATKNPVEFLFQHIEGVRNDGYISISEVQKRVQKFMSKRNAKKHLFNNVEKLLVRQVSSSVCMEYLMMPEHHVPDYGMMKINYVFLYQVINEGLPNSPIPHTVRLYTDSGNTLVSWDMEYHQPAKKYDVKLPIFFEHKPLDDLENEYEKLHTQYAYLSQHSLLSLATALTQERLLDKSKNLISYSGLSMSYLGVIENELRKIIMYANNAKGDNKSNKKIMWRDIVTYFEKHGFPLALFDSKLQLSWVEQLKKFNPLRNKVAHGEFVSYEEFKDVKQFALNSKLMEWISYYKFQHQGVEQENSLL